MDKGKRMKKITIESFAELSIIWAIIIIIHIIWVGLEIVFEGGTQPSVSDTIIGLILAYSIRKNLGWNITYTEKQK